MAQVAGFDVMSAGDDGPGFEVVFDEGGDPPRGLDGAPSLVVGLLDVDRGT